MNTIIKLNKESVKILSMGSIVQSENHRYLYFPFWLKETINDLEYEMLSLYNIPRELYKMIECRRGFDSGIPEGEEVNYDFPEKAKEKGFVSKDNLLGVNKSYYFLWLCELQKWLREEHDIHVWVTAPTDGFYDACVFRDKTNYYRKFDDFTTNETDFTTYESAFEDGLFEALKLIK